MRARGQHVNLEAQLAALVELLLEPTDWKKRQKLLRLAG
jgi:hypothetical protein